MVCLSLLFSILVGGPGGQVFAYVVMPRKIHATARTLTAIRPTPCRADVWPRMRRLGRMPRSKLQR